MSPTETYAVLGNIDHDGKRYVKGDAINLSQTAADALIACGVLAEQGVAPAEVVSQEPEETPAQQEPEEAPAQQEPEETSAQQEPEETPAQQEPEETPAQQGAKKKKGKGTKKQGVSNG